jgi:hypothetical protein
MKRTYILRAAGLLYPALLLAQAQSDVVQKVQSLLDAQQAQALGQPLAPGGRGGRGGAVIPALRAEKGKPFSATVTNKTTQTYIDGTHVSQATTTVEYRDAEGRTRIETSESGASSSEPMKSITIRDPVTGMTYRLNSVQKSAIKLAGPAMASGAAGGRGARGGARGGAMPPTDEQVQIVQKLQQMAAELQKKNAAANPDAAAEAARRDSDNIVEDLGATSVNGVPAHGTRITKVVPVGAIGNDREFRSVTERWFSVELNLLIKSVSTDPRFGTSTYELTNISLLPPDPSLFQVPADYSLRDDIR